MRACESATKVPWGSSDSSVAVASRMLAQAIFVRACSLRIATGRPTQDRMLEPRTSR
jgi:hypothetical protein